MLTDYHVHLRPGDRDATADRHFTRENVDRYLEAAAERGIAALGVSEHVHRFRQALAVWDHPFWRAYAVDDLDRYCAFVREETDLALGIEADFVPGREEAMRALLEEREWDYVLGSVHFLRDSAVDMEGEHDIWRSADPDAVWARYFDSLGEAARSGLFDVLAHPDDHQVWPHETAHLKRHGHFDAGTATAALLACACNLGAPPDRPVWDGTTRPVKHREIIAAGQLRLQARHTPATPPAASHSPHHNTSSPATHSSPAAPA